MIWKKSTLLLAALFVTVGAQALAAQPVRHATAPQMQPGSNPGGLSSFALEALGASVGSAAGLFLVSSMVSDECDVEDLTCNLRSAAAGVAVGTAGSALGDYLSGRLFDTRPSGVGAAIGAVLGAAAGLGVWHLVTEDLNIMSKSTGAVATYVVTQGVVTALGSRIVRKH